MARQNVVLNTLQLHLTDRRCEARYPVREQTILEIGTITLDWNSWVPWPDVFIANRGGGGVHIPNRKPGVYEVKYANHGGDERLYIGETSNLRYRIRQGLVTGRARHSAGRRIRGQEYISKLAIRWAETHGPSCAEEELLNAYRA
jgi:hypothetical protein